MKILSITSIRSDFDLLSPLYELFESDPAIDFKLLVCGAHCSPTFGSTISYIQEQRFSILAKIDSLLDSDSRSSRVKSASVMLISSIDIISGWNPNLIIVAGDREECLMGAIAGAYIGIPVLHFYGGDHSCDGHIDNPVRHAVSKLSTVHFVTHQSHKDRLLAIGEESERTFVIGNISLDRFLRLKHLSASPSPIQATDKSALVIFHPLGDEIEPGSTAISNILEALIDEGYLCHISSPNSDPGNREILRVIAQYAEKYPSNIRPFGSLPNNVFIDLFASASVLIGNSSAGILEAPSLKKPVINVGLRQSGRLAADNVIFTGISKPAISTALKIVRTKEFIKACSSVVNPYGDGFSAIRALNLIKSINFLSILRKKADPLSLLALNNSNS
jgi:UDP-hydrolysing UDP-N-acetyl-D-glucosamine 2-epimerase